MNNSIIISLLIMFVLFEMCRGQLSSVPIKSHKVLTKGITSNNVNSLYDNNADTIGSFYSNKETNVQLEFDLGKNYLIDHVVVKMKGEKKMHKISFLVGNSFNNKELLYVCSKLSQEETYKCEPECRQTNILRPGIIGRILIMTLLVPSNWISVYDVQVYSFPTSASEDISSNRHVLPSICSSQLWLLTNKTTSPDKSTPTTTITEILFEKSYIVTEIDVQFGNSYPKILDIVLTSSRGQNHSLSINLSECLSKNSLFTCKINSKTFSSRQVKIVTTGLIKIFIRGKPVFYPKLEMKTSVNVKENLRMTCGYSQCDLSVHSDCSEEAIKSGVKFGCVNKRLIRMPSGNDLDSYVIVNNGKVESVWQNTKFSVDSSNDDSMVVSMPRGYQYFGQYKCGCIVADMMNTEISSDVSILKETDFLEDLFFETLVQYKLSENEEAALNNVSNNIIYLSRSGLESTFIPVKITMFSLIFGNSIHVNFPMSETNTDNSFSDRSIIHYVKAFEKIRQSWSVVTYKYELEEIYAELIHGQSISILSNSSSKPFSQRQFIKLLDEDKVKTKPAFWSVIDSKTVQIKVMYAGNKEAKLFYREKTCRGANNSKLAIFTKDSCKATDRRISCFQYNSASLVSFKDETNFAKEVVVDLTSKTNASIDKVILKSNFTLEQDDVIIMSRYVNLTSSSKNPATKVLKIELDFVSKKIYDFIPCGSVIIKITIPNKDNLQKVLEVSKLDIDVELEGKEMNITVMVTIEGAKGSHVSKLQIIDPRTLGVSNVELQEDKTLNINWNGIDHIAKDLLESYEVKIDTTMVACDSTTTETKSVSKSKTLEPKSRYQLLLSDVSQQYLTKVSVSIQPIFNNDNKGQIVKIIKNFNTIAPTTLSIDSMQSLTERKITVLPSQSDLSCDIKEVKFNVTGINVEKFQWKSETLDKLKYKLTNLVPGRKYLVTAKVLYKSGPEDIVSKPYTFETSDDISILRMTHVAQLNEKINISCTVEIGPEDKFIKTVEWLRADKSSLPDGVKSLIYASNPKVAFLIIEKAVADYSGEYGCFAKPSASFGSMKMTLVVDDLVVTPMEQQVDFSQKNEIVSVTCSSSAVGKNKLVWVDPSNSTIPEGGSDKYSITNIKNDQNVYKATLTIKDVTLATSGTYKCHKSIGNITAKKEFFLYGNQKLEIEALNTSSYLIGEKLRLRCIAKPGFKTQKVMWETPNIKNGTNMSYPYPSDKTTQDIEIKNSLSIHSVTCKLFPSLKNDQEPLSKSFTVKFQSKIVVEGLKEVNAGENVKLTCTGYPNKMNMELKWVFYPKNKNETAIDLENESSNLATIEPIKLELNLTNVQQEKAGRYECKFKDETRSSTVLQIANSINLSVNTVENPVPVPPIDPKKSAHSTMSQWSMTCMLTVTVLLLFSVCYSS